MNLENNIDIIIDNIYLGNFIGAQNIINNNSKIDVIINFYKYKHTLNDNIIYYHIPYNFKTITIDECWIIIKNIIKITNTHYNKKILFCCKRGHHRSACAVLLYLILNNNCNYEIGKKYIKQIRKKSLNRKGNMIIALKYYAKLVNKIYV
jgi:hypothetical protein